MQAATGTLFPGYEVFVEPVKEHRFVLVLRGEGLGGVLTETDPLAKGKMPLPVMDISGTPAGALTAMMFNKWVQAARRPRRSPRANSLNLRGIASDPGVPRFPEIYGMRAAASPFIPCTRELRDLLAWRSSNLTVTSPPTRYHARASLENFDFFFIQLKKTDSYGEDGNFDAKVHVIETVDDVIPRILALNPGAVIVTGDHSTPALLRSHSWHPVPRCFGANSPCPIRCRVSASAPAPAVTWAFSTPRP